MVAITITANNDTFLDRKKFLKIKSLKIKKGEAKYSISSGNDTKRTAEKTEIVEDKNDNKSQKINIIEAEALKVLADEIKRFQLSLSKPATSSADKVKVEYYGVAGIEMLFDTGHSTHYDAVIDFNGNPYLALEAVYVLATGDTSYTDRYKTRKDQIAHIMCFASSPLQQFIHNTTIDINELIKKYSNKPQRP